VVSYYTKGALVALALDLKLRAETSNRISLDDVMRALWQRHGQGEQRCGIGDEDIRLLAEELSGLNLEHFFAEAVHGTTDVDLAQLLQPFGIRLKRSASSTSPSLGVQTGSDGSEVRLTTVYEGSPAQVAGLSAGDLLLAINGLRVTPSTLDRLLSRRQAGETVHIHAFRRDELMEFTVQLGAPAKDRHQLQLQRKRNSLRKNWLQG